MLNLYFKKLRSVFIEIWQHAGFWKYFKNIGWMMFGRIGAMAISFFVSIYMARHLGPENYGMLSYAISFTALFSFVATLGIDLILYRDLVDRPNDHGVLMGTSFGLKIFGGLIAFILILLFLPFFNNDRLINHLIVIIALSFVFQSFNVINFYFQAKVVSKSITIVSFVSVLILSLAKVLIILFGQNMIFLASVFLFEPIIYGIGYLIIYQRDNQNIFAWRFKIDLAIKMLKASWPLILSAAFGVIYSRVDQIMIKYMIDVSSVGYYDAAVRIAEMWNFIPAIIIYSLFPALVNAKKISYALYNYRVIKMAFFLLLGSLAVILPLYSLSDFLIRLLYGDAFLAAVPVLRLYVWAGIGISLGWLLNNYLIAEHKTVLTFVVNFLAMVINIVLNLILIPKKGIEGAALATLISYSAIPVFGYVMILYQRFKEKDII